LTRAGLVTDLRVVGALGRRAIAQTMRRPQLLAPILLFPSLLLAVNVGGAGRGVELRGFPSVDGFLDFQLAAAILQSNLLTGVSAGIALALDIELGFIDRLIASPVRRSAVVTGRLSAAGVLGALAASWFLIVGAVFGAEVKGGASAVLVVLALSALASITFGALGAALALGAGRASVVQGIFPLVFVILFLSSAFFPRELMLEPAGTVAAWNPLSLIVDGMREPIVGGIELAATLNGLAGVAIIAAVSGGLNVWALRHRLRSA
jgi:ABC-2 type transport system permease protein